MGVPNQNGTFMDSLADFSAGMNSDVPPIALPKNQLAFATNATLRGNYFTHRPPYRNLSISYSDSSIQERFESGYFQGACYYKPDTGIEFLVVSVGGYIYKVNATLEPPTVEDITPTDGPNPAAISKSWLWQSENYLIINNGSSDPIIFNGNESLRSLPGEVVGTLSASVVIPQVGSSAPITLTGSYTGPYSSPVRVYNGPSLIGSFEVTQFSSGYAAVRLTNRTIPQNTVIPSGTKIYYRPSIKAITSTAVSGVRNVVGGITVFYTYPTNTSNLIDMQPGVGAGASFYYYIGSNVYILTIGASGFQSTSAAVNSPAEFAIPTVIPSGTTIYFQSGGSDVIVATTSTSISVPASGQTFDIPVQSSYTGSSGALVIVEMNGNDSVEVASIAPLPPVSSSGLYLTAISLIQASGTIPSGATINTIAGLPAGKMGVYGLGRNWICQPDGQSYFATDIVGGSSGSIANKFRDAVLNVTENNFLAGGGAFRVPGAGQQINAMRFPATLDSSLGQGPLQVLTQNTTFSCNAPVQRSQWQDLTNPIQTQSLVGGGALSQESTVAVNGDLFFRSLDGIRSLRLARQDFQTSYSNTPQSVEMNRVLMEDNRSLLGYSSAIVFDNRLLMTASPVQSQGGVYHSKLIALNLDPNSSLRVKQPPIYDGAWEGMNVLQLVVGTFNGIERAFAFTYDTETSKIGLTEILPTSSSNLFDNGEDAIQFSFESPALFYQPETATRQLLRLNDGEIIVKDISGDCRFDVYYRPDYDSTWRSWHSWEVTDSPNYQPRMGLGQPNLKIGDDTTGRPHAVGYHFQVKVVITGSCTVMGMNFYAVAQPTPQFAKPLTALTPLST